MKTIPLTKGYTAIVDDEDYEYLIQWEWYAKKSKGGMYAVRKEWRHERNNPDKRGFIRMHNIVAERIGLKCGPKEKIDHCNFKTLDNRRSELRVLTNSESRLNQRPRGKTSKFLGVCWDKQKSKWRADYTPISNQPSKHIGYFDDEILAAQRALEARFIADQLVPIWALERWEQACQEKQYQG